MQSQLKLHYFCKNTQYVIPNSICLGKCKRNKVNMENREDSSNMYTLVSVEYILWSIRPHAKM